MRNIINGTFRVGQKVVTNGRSGSFMSYGGYRHNEAGETIATRGIVYVGKGKVIVADIDAIKAVEEVQGD